MNIKNMQEDKKEISLIDFASILWKKKFFIITFSLAFALISVLYALSLPNKYQASILIVPSPEESSMNLSQKYGGLAGLAGISIPEGQTNLIDISKEVIKSRKFIEKFISQNDILIPLMASKSWSYKTNQLVINKQIYDTTLKKWVRDVDLPQKAEPSMQEAYSFWMDNIFSMTEDRTTGFVTVKITHHSPHIAKEWALNLINDLNITIRDDSVQEAEQSIKYLNQEINGTNSEELKSLFYEIVKSKTEIKMLAYARKDYIFKVIDPPVAPEKKSSPNRALICILITFIGGFISIFIVLANNFLLKKSID